MRKMGLSVWLNQSKDHMADLGVGHAPPLAHRAKSFLDGLE